MKTTSLFFIISILGINYLFGQSIVADYPFTGDANDQSGNEHHAIVYGAFLTTDRFGNENSAYLFDGIDDYIDTETSFDFQERTISVWALCTDTALERQVLDQDALSLDYGSFGISFKEGSLRGNAGGDGSNIIQQTPVLNQWHHIALVRNSQETKYYVDGKPVYSSTPSSNGSSVYPNPELVIGVSRKETDEFFIGKIDDLLIYSCELDSSQIDSLFDNYETPVNIGHEKSPISGVLIYPNPGKDYITLNFEDPVNSNIKISLVNSKGQFIRRIHQGSDNKDIIERKNLPGGLYFIQIMFEDGSFINRKIIFSS